MLALPFPMIIKFAKIVRLNVLKELNYFTSFKNSLDMCLTILERKQN